MPLELLLEKQKSSAAFWQDQALDLIAHRQVSTYLDQFVNFLVHISQVAFLLQLLVARKIFQVTYCICYPTVKGT